MRTANISYMRTGSHLYGLNTPDSDEDFKGIFIPSLKELLLGGYKTSEKETTGTDESKNGAGDVDKEVMSLQRFIETAIAGDMNAIDMLHCNDPIVTSPRWEALVRNRQRFYTKGLKPFLGYINKQAAKYGIRGSRLGDLRAAIDNLNRLGGVINDKTATLERAWGFLYEGEHARKIQKTNNNRVELWYLVNGKMYASTMSLMDACNQMLSVYTKANDRVKKAEKNVDVDWKALSHALRAGYQARDIYLHGDFQYPLKENAYLLDVKLGKFDYKTNVEPELEALMEKLEILSNRSKLPEEIDKTFWDGFLIGTYEQEFGISVDGS